MAERVAEYVQYQEKDDIGIWRVTDIVEAMEAGSLQEGERHFRDVASDPSMTSVVVIVGGAEDLPKETLEHINEKWTELAEETDIDATAYVAEGVARLAISARNEAEGIDTRGFEDTSDALEWAKQY